MISISLCIRSTNVSPGPAMMHKAKKNKGKYCRKYHGRGSGVPHKFIKLMRAILLGSVFWTVFVGFAGLFFGRALWNCVLTGWLSWLLSFWVESECVWDLSCLGAVRGFLLYVLVCMVPLLGIYFLTSSHDHFSYSKHKIHSTSFHQFVSFPQMKPILSTRAFGPSYSAGWIVTCVKHENVNSGRCVATIWSWATSGVGPLKFSNPLKYPCRLPKNRRFLVVLSKQKHGHGCKAWEWFLSELKRGPPFCWSKCLCKTRTWHSLQLVGYGSWSHGLLNKCNNKWVGFHPLHSTSSSSKNVTVYSLVKLEHHPK